MSSWSCQAKMPVRPAPVLHCATKNDFRMSVPEGAHAGCVQALVQGLQTWKTWPSMTLRPPPALSLRGRVPSVVVTGLASLHGADPVGSHRRVMEQRRTLRGGVSLRKPFEGVEQDVVRERYKIKREVAFKHEPVRTTL